MSFIFEACATPSVAVNGQAGRFPVRRIYCVGRNYAAHAREMGADEREAPFFFTKFPDTIAESGAELRYPSRTKDYQHEGELVIALGAPVFDITPDRALEAVFGYACGLDMTRRDLQFAARDKGRPWDMGKNFSQAAVVGPIAMAQEVGHPSKGRLQLAVNGEVRQHSDLSSMTWSCAEIISALSGYDALAAGDLIFTGTPAGVGPVAPGDRILVEIENLPALGVTVR